MNSKRYDNDEIILDELTPQTMFFGEAFGVDSESKSGEWDLQVAIYARLARKADAKGETLEAASWYALLGKYITDSAFAYAERCLIDSDNWVTQPGEGEK